MTNAQPQPYVPGPARVPVPYGLFSIPFMRDAPDSHWEGSGVRWQDFDGSDELGVIGRLQTPQSDTSGITKEFSTNLVEETAGIFTIYAQMKISAGPWTAEKAQEWTTSILNALRERTVERVLAGTIGSLSPNLGDASSIGSVNTIRDAVRLLEQNLADTYGSLGVLHMSRSDALVGLATDACLETRAGRLYTKLGTPVVAGQGYPSGEAFCTSALIGYESAIFPSVGNGYELLDRTNNDLYAISEQTFSIGWDAEALASVDIGDSPA